MAKNKVSLKKNLSSMQVIKTLKVLMQGDYTMQELIQKLNENEQDAVFNNSVISKYINTCRFLGIDIPKIHNKYYVTTLPFGIEFSNKEQDLITALCEMVKNEMSAKYFKNFDGFIQKLNRYSNKQIARIDKDEYKCSFEYFEHAVKQRKKVNLLFKNQGILECIPLNIVEFDGKTYFKIYKNRVRLIDVNRLSGIQILNQYYIPPYENEQVVVYNLKGKLAERYELRENETLISKEDGCITISNRNEPKEILFSRLLRYDDKCEIKTPKIYREEMKQLLSDMLKNYEEG